MIQASRATACQQSSNMPSQWNTTFTRGTPRSLRAVLAVTTIGFSWNPGTPLWTATPATNAKQMQQMQSVPFNLKNKEISNARFCNASTNELLFTLMKVDISHRKFSKEQSDRFKKKTYLLPIAILVPAVSVLQVLVISFFKFYLFLILFNLNLVLEPYKILERKHFYFWWNRSERGSD